jgi:hypothetical protein
MFMKCSQMRVCGTVSVARVSLCLQGGRQPNIVIPDGMPCAPIRKLEVVLAMVHPRRGFRVRSRSERPGMTGEA